MLRGARAAAAAAALVTLGGLACIIPDARIDVTGDFSNPGAVRIVQAVGLSSQVNDACQDAVQNLAVCPVPPETQPPGLLENAQQQFCVCPERDNDALAEFDIYVEDPDLDEEGNPADSLLGAFLLDLPPDPEDPSEFVDYENHLPGNEEAALVVLGTGSYRDAIERPNPNLKHFVITDGIDLCNDNNLQEPERPGLHTLRLVVTDRPWYIPVQRDKTGAVKEDDEGLPLRKDEEPKIGVPDLPGGATYAVANYIFRCLDSGDEEEAVDCNCSDQEP